MQQNMNDLLNKDIQHIFINSSIGIRNIITRKTQWLMGGDQFHADYTSTSSEATGLFSLHNNNEQHEWIMQYIFYYKKFKNRLQSKVKII